MSGKSVHGGAAASGSRGPVAILVMRAMLAMAIVVAAGLGWWSWSHRLVPADGDAAVDAAGAALAADGSVTLSAAQRSTQGIETSAVEAATQLPVAGLPAQATAPLHASAQVVAQYAGVVTRILVDEGAAVRQGQALARIQSRDALAAQAELGRARSEATAAALQARRDAALLAEGIISVSRNEQSQARTDAAQSALRQASGALSQLRLVAGGQAGEYELLAPLSGQVVRRQLAPGQAVAALDAAFVVADPALIDIRFSAPLRLRSALRPGLRLRLPDGRTARVAAVGADADPFSQSLRARARIEPGDGMPYTPGQQLSVSLLLPVPDGALAVPPSALLPAGQNHVLYVAQAVDGAGAGAGSGSGPLRIRAVAVRLLGGDEGLSVVSAIEEPQAIPGALPPALAQGMQVVTRGTALLKTLIPLQ